MMQHPPRPVAMPAVSRYAGVAMFLWAAVLLGIAALRWGESWAVAPLVLGVIVGALAMTGFLRRSMIAPLMTALLVCSAAMLGAGVVMVEMMPAVAGMIMLAIAGSAGVVVVAGREADAAAGASGGGAAVSSILKELEEVREALVLSDSVRRVLNRDHETSLLRSAVRRDIEAGRLEEALAICHVLAGTYGLVAEAEEMRARIVEAQQVRDGDNVRAAIDGFEQLLLSHEWTAAHREAARIHRVFGGAYPIPDLDARLQAARSAHKEELERRFLEVAQRDDAEGAMVLLKELDRYLTPAQAEGLSEVARGVVGRHRENLGVRFRMAVQDHRWGDAVDSGEAIMDEFPNTRMAAEVRSVIDVLRLRARRNVGTGHPVG